MNKTMKNSAITQFELDIPKNIKYLVPCVKKDKDIYQNTAKTIAIFKNGDVLATDTHVLRKITMELPEECGAIGNREPNDLMPVLRIVPKIAGKIAGKKVGVTLREEERETETSDYRNRKVKKKTVFHVVDMVCGNEEHHYEYVREPYTNYRRVVPEDTGGMSRLRLSEGGAESLRKICGVICGESVVASVAEGGRVLALRCDTAYSRESCSFMLGLAEPSERKLTFSMSLGCLCKIVDGIDGTIYYRPSAPGVEKYGSVGMFLFDGVCGTTLMMPDNLEFCNQESIAGAVGLAGKTMYPYSFESDMEGVLPQLRDSAQWLWAKIMEAYHDGDRKWFELLNGEYTAADIEKCRFIDSGHRSAIMKGGLYRTLGIDLPEEPVNISVGNISLTVGWDRVFDMLARWEGALKSRRKFVCDGSVVPVLERKSDAEDEVYDHRPPQDPGEEYLERQIESEERRQQDEDGEVSASVTMFMAHSSISSHAFETMARRAGVTVSSPDLDILHGRVTGLMINAGGDVTFFGADSPDGFDSLVDTVIKTYESLK